MKRIFFLFILAFITLFFVTSFVMVDNSNLSRNIKNFIPKNIKDVLNSTVFYVPKLRKEFNRVKLELDLANSEIDELTYQLRLSELPSENIKTYISEKGNISIEVKNHFLPYDVKDSFYKDKSNGEKPYTSYIQKKDEKIFITFQSGKVLFFDEDDLSKEKINFKEIKNNLRKKFVKNTELFVGIKGSLIKDNYFYISYTDIKKDTCYSIGIARANLNYKELEFEKFLDFEECIERTGKIPNREFGMWSQGGKMIDYGNNKIMFSTGNYSDLTVSQNLESPFGKVLEIDTTKKDYSVYSYGHRNPQGLTYIKEKNILLETEHGTSGGDEINKIIKGKNYGYPTSSYGRSTRKGFKYKNHSNHGFVEPIKYFEYSTPPTEIVEIPEELLNKENYFFLNTLGSLKIVLLKINKNFDGTDFVDEIDMSERIRDMIYLPNIKKFLIVQELSSKLGVVTIKNTQLN